MQKLPPILILLLAFGLAACQSAAATPTPAPAVTDIPSPVPASSTMEAVDYCVACHTDKEQLISTAKPVEAAESESKGVG